MCEQDYVTNVMSMCWDHPKGLGTKLLAIEFIMNSVWSSTMQFTLFYLNYRRNPSPMIWKTEEVYFSLCQFVEKMKEAIMSVHNAIIAVCIQHMVQVNKKCLPLSFKLGDLVYLSMKNISIPKGQARKLAPKYLGPFPITKVLKEGAVAHGMGHVDYLGHSSQ